MFMLETKWSLSLFRECYSALPAGKRCCRQTTANTVLFTITQAPQGTSYKLAASSMGPAYFRDVTCLRFQQKCLYVVQLVKALRYKSEG
jgi:hypothetical protein